MRRSCVRVLVDVSQFDAHESATKVRPSDDCLGCNRTLDHRLICQGVGRDLDVCLGIGCPGFDRTKNGGAALWSLEIFTQFHHAVVAEFLGAW